MKLNQFKTALATAFAITSGIAASTAADCASIGEKTSDAIADEPSHLLAIVADQIAENEACTCEIVSAAIAAVENDKEQVRQIVVTAVTAATAKAAEITECALAAAPDAAAEIKAGLSEVFEGGVAYSAKGKQVVVEETDYGPEPVAVSGVYLIAPVAPSSAFVGLDRELTKSQIRRLARSLGLLDDDDDRDREGGGGGGGGGQTPPNGGGNDN